MSTKKPLSQRQAGIVFMVGGILFFAMAVLMPSEMFFNTDEWPSNTTSAVIAAAICVVFAIVCLVIAGIYINNANANSKNSIESQSSPTSSTANTSLELELKKLDDMKARGVIDETEYKKLRENLISRS